MCNFCCALGALSPSHCPLVPASGEVDAYARMGLAPSSSEASLPAASSSHPSSTDPAAAPSAPVSADAATSLNSLQAQGTAPSLLGTAAAPSATTGSDAPSFIDAGPAAESADPGHVDVEAKQRNVRRSISELSASPSLSPQASGLGEPRPTSARLTSGGEATTSAASPRHQPDGKSCPQSASAFNKIAEKLQ